MPIRVPVGALPEAHRVICMRSIRSIARGKIVPYGFLKPGSKKCQHCTDQKEACNPVPDYVEEEFGLFWEELLAFQALTEKEVDADSMGAVSHAAWYLGLCVQVTRAQDKDCSPLELLTAGYYQAQAFNKQLLEEVRAIHTRLIRIEHQADILSRAVSSRYS